MRDDRLDHIFQEKLAQLEAPYDASDWSFMEERLDGQLDVSLRSKMDELSAEYEPADWSLMEQKLTEEAFDLQIREKLSNKEIEFDTSDWHQMAGQLHGQFDASLEKNLSDYTVPYDPADWEAMVAFLDKPLFKAIRNKFNSFEIPYRHSDWRLMSRRLQEVNPIPTWKAWYIDSKRAVITSAFLLLLMMSAPFITQDTIFRSDPELSSTETEHEDGIQQDIFSQPKNISQKQQIGIVGVDVNLTEAKEPTTEVLPRSEGQISASLEEVEVTEIQYGDFDRSLSLVISPDSLDKLFLLNEIELYVLGVEDALLQELIIDSINTHSFVAVDYSLNGPPPLVSLAKEKKGFAFNPELRLGTFFGTATSRAELNDSGKFGYLGGVRVELKFNELVSFTSGVLYAEKKYSHTYYKFNIDDNASGVTRRRNALDASFKMVEIPALIRINMPSEKNAFYVQTGIVSMISLEESYSHFDPNSANNSDKSQNILFSQDPRYLDPTAHQNRFSTYVGNIYGSAGVEFGLSNTLSLQIEPYFQMGLQKMGPEKKNLFSGGIGLGLMHQFGKSTSPVK